MTTHPTLFIAPTRIGDAVLATSLLAHVAATDPKARVTIITSTLSAPLYEGYPQLERVIPVVKRSYSRHWLTLWRQTVGTRWYSVWDLRNSILSRGLWAKHIHRFSAPNLQLPKATQYAQALHTGPLPAPRLWPQAEHAATAEALLPDNARYILFAPIANWGPKEWPLGHYIALAKTLLDGAFAGYRPVIITAGHEREKARPMLDALAAYHPVDLTEGTTHLLSIYAAMQRAHGFIGNDSGLMHMAVASGIPTIGLFGPTPNIGNEAPHVVYLYAPEGDLNRLTPDDVAKTFCSMIKR